MAYENPFSPLRLEAFSRSKVISRWQWAWEGLACAIPGHAGSDGVIDLLGSLSGVSVGNVERVASPATGEFHFADTSSYITLGDQPQLKITGPVTVAAMHLADTTDRAALWAYAGSLSGGLPFALVYSFAGNQRYSFWNDNTGNGVSSASSFAPGNRNFVLARRNGANADSPVCDIFVNGQLEASATSPLDPTWDFADTGYQQAINRFGAYAGYSGVGYISNILVWNRALSDAEVFALSEDPWGPFRQISHRKVTTSTVNTVNVSFDANVLGGITHVGSGAFTAGDYNQAVSPPLPTGILANDLLVSFSHFRSTTGTLTSTWATQTSFKGSGNSLLVSYRVATGTDTAPTITPASGAAGQHTSNIVMAFRGCDPTTPFGPSGTAAQFSAEDIGPINAPTVTASDGAVLVVAGRNDPTGSTIDFPVLTGDGLSWQELVDAATVANISHLGVNFAPWSGGAPTLTAKTFDIAAGSTSAVSSGVMITLKKASAGLVTYVGKGTDSRGDHTAVLTPELPAVLAGDLLFIVAYLRNAGTLSISSGWTEHSLVDTTVNASSFYLQTWYKIAGATNSSPTITLTGGSTSPQSLCLAFCLAYRGVDPAVPLGTAGADSFNATAATVGPIAAPSALPQSGGVIVLGIRNATVWTSVALLDGDGQTWVELFDTYTHTVNSLGISLVADHAIWSTGTPTITAKTFTPTGGAGGPGMGKMFVLRAAGVASGPVTNQTTIPFDVSVAASPNVSVSADVSVITSGLWFGPPVLGDHDDALIAQLPQGLINGDFVMAFGYLRNAGTLNISTDWQQHSLLDTTVNGSSFYLQTWYTFYSSTTTLTDSFQAGAYTVNALWTEGQTYGNWFTNFLGFGSAKVVDTPTSAVQLTPGDVDVTGQPTSATLITTSTFYTGNLDITCKMRLLAQLRNVSPNPWESPWLLWNVGQTPTGVVLSANYLALKTNGWELGLILGNDLQTFIATGDTPTVSSSFKEVRIIQNGYNVSIFIDSVQVGTTINDSRFFQNGYVGLYTEDAQVEFTDVVIQTVGTSTPTISVSGGSTSPQSLTTAFTMAARGVSQVSPFGVDGADSFNATAQNIGPISLPTSTPSSAIAIVLGIRNATPWTSAATLTGDNLTWVEGFDGIANTVAGLSTDIVLNYATWEGLSPTLTAKTFTITGGAAGPGMGKAFVLNRAQTAFISALTNADAVIAGTNSTQVVADVYVTATQFSIQTSLDAFVGTTGTAVQQVFGDLVIGLLGTRTTSLDVSVLAQTGTTKTISCGLDVTVNPALLFVSAVTFFDAIVNPPLVSPNAPRSATQELSDQTTDTAWLVLLTLSHEEMPTPIRVTSDGVPTLSRGYNFSPFPFDVILPDDVEGQPPQAQLRIDNTTQEIIAELRNLTTPPSLTIEIVRSISVDIVEYGWVGLRWTASSYDKNVITGTLTVDDLAKEEFPFMSFDSRWRGLWS